jgi:ribose-phosphate pyrophosphokinase
VSLTTGGAVHRSGAVTIHVFPDSQRFGRHLARAAARPWAPVAVHRFPDCETLVRVALPVARHAVLVRSLHEPNNKLVETALAADALRRAGARRVTLVAPYLPYMRQDAVFRPGEPLSQRAIGQWLGRTYDAVLTIEAHLHRVARLDEVIPCAARSLPAAPAITRWVQRLRSPPLLVGPDDESAPWVRAIAAGTGSPWLVGHKHRLRDRLVRVDMPAVPAMCRRAIVIDDIASSGATLAAAARALRRAGIRHVDAIVVHAIFGQGALDRIRRGGVRRIISCDTVPHPTNGIACAELVATVLRTVLR